MSLLTERQKEELHLSILDYLHSSGLEQAYDALRSELGLDHIPDPKARTAGLLEKKWGSVIRLQKKIMDLENKNSALQEEIALAPSARRNASQTDWLPRTPARHTLTGHRGPINRVAFHPVHTVVATASEDATVKLWDWETGEFERTLKGHTKAVQDMEFDSKGTKLVTCSSDLSIKIWDCEAEYKNTKSLVDHDHAVSSARFLPGDDHIVSASRDRTIKMWDVARGFCVRTFHGHAEWVRLVIPSEDGKLLASCSNDQTARIWDPATGEVKSELRGHEHVVESLTFAPPASYAAIRELCSLSGPAPKGPGAYLATASRDKSIKLWDVSSGQLLRTFGGHDNWVRALVFHPNGKYLLSGSDDKTLRVWDLKTGRCARTVEAHSHFVQCLAWGRAKVSGGDGGEERPVNVIATGSVDQSAKIWTP
ncbi:miller-Dieker lissencephaly protein [Dacryopinax primogenitus]|uniref:Nuclear distribution protein PAC1 n=1 Tax=Dacryopinax primogenitus (strain DJM 731) TaxID=1858805 RepID=M5FT01_DACPD|nr:miller-Dieker lissencephaly protein [Dacryopinax primogenitus]EJU00666.1 miller-Dieker lissencephaly protein [Dacryopinax primogenitus]